MILAFTLTMQGAASWNGKWSGEGRLFCITRTYRTKKSMHKALSIIQGGPYSYCWSDGLRASIAVREVDSREAARLRSQSQGFCGYDWMVDTIEWYGKPLASHEIDAYVASQRGAAV